MSKAKKQKVEAVPIEEPLSIDYAPTGRAACKKCQGPIAENAVRVGRLVRSRFHDGFDTQLMHWRCGSEYGTSIDDFRGWMTNLLWPDVEKLAAEMGDELDPELVPKYRQRNMWIQNAALHLSEAPVAILRAVFEANDMVFSDRAKAIALARQIADNIFFGKLPLCPTCNTNGLYQDGTDIRCHGWFSASTKCTFKFRLENLLQNRPKNFGSLPVGDEMIKSRLSRSGMISIPEDVASHKIFKTFIVPKELQAERKRMAKSAGVAAGGGVATSVISTFDSEDEDSADVENWLVGMKFVFCGLPSNEVAELSDKIIKHGGVVYEDVIVAGPDRTTHLVVGEDELFKDPKSARYRKSNDAGIPIVKSEFVEAATNETEVSEMKTTSVEIVGRSKKLPNALINGIYKLVENETVNDRPVFKNHKSLHLYYSSKGKWKIAPSLDEGKGHVAINLDSKAETPGEISGVWDVFGGKENGFAPDPNVHVVKKTNMASSSVYGPLLRQRKYLKQFVVEGAVGKKLPKIKEAILGPQKRSKKRLPPIPGSPILTVDEECMEQFAGPIIYADTSTNDVYNVLLTKTDSATNVNKFYTIQLVAYKNKKGGKFEYAVFRKWGRFGGSGAGPMNGSLAVEFGPDKADAVQAFREKFTECTGIDFDLRGVVPQKPGRYAYVELNGQDENQPVVKKVVKKSSEPSKLEKDLIDLIQLIFDIDMIEREMSSSMDIDTSRLPPNALSKRQLSLGLSVLREIEHILLPSEENMEILDGPSKELKLIDCANRFYTIVPHCFDRKQSVPVIESLRTLKQRILNIEDLMQIVELEEMRTSSVSHAATLHRPIPDVQYEELNCKLETVKKDSIEWNLIAKTIAETHAKSHDTYKIKVDKIFRTDRDGEWDRFRADPSYDKKRRLLWHGSRLSNWASILKNGLRIAPKEAPVTGYMFGKGVYFADCSSKSANYCFPTPEEPDGLLVLCEVAIGKPYLRLEAQYEAPSKCRKKECDSTWGIGEHAPLQEAEFPDGSIIPCGPIESNALMIQVGKTEWPRAKPSLQYNEYIVYRESQLAMKYVVHVKFEFNKK